MGKYRINTAAPNLTCICIDACRKEDYSGRIYHKYSSEGIPFPSSGSMIMLLDSFFDQINYPQTSTRCRSFKKMKKEEDHEPKKDQMPLVQAMTAQEVLDHRGKIATFILHVQYRQNSTWQGNLIWADEEIKKDFFSVLEFLKLLDSALCANESE